MELDIAVKEQGDALAEMLAGQETFEDLAALKKRFSYYELDIDAGRCRLRGYARNEKKLSQARRLSGFFAIVTLGLDWDPKTTFMHYKVRDEQEKYFEQMKDQMVADRQRNWSEEGKTGRLFILFVSLVLGSYVRHIWRGSALHKMFSSSLDILDEMRPIRCVEHPKRAKFLTPFIGRQLDICAAFGFDVPKGCDKVYVSRKVDGKKRGRPRKAQVVQDL